MTNEQAAARQAGRDCLVRELVEALEKVTAYAERNECTHEDTYRGGVIWTICRDCHRKWADDEGGFEPYQQPAVLADAYAVLARAKEQQQ